MTRRDVMEAVHIICRVAPEFSHIVRRCVFIESDKYNTFYCDRNWRVFYPKNPAEGIVQGNDCVFAVFHELLHITFRHFEREVKPRNVWMIATDLAINSFLRHLFKHLKLQYHIPSVILYPEQYDLPQLMSAGWYFNELFKNEDNNDNQSDDSSDDKSGNSSGGGSDDSGDGNDNSNQGDGQDNASPQVNVVRSDDSSEGDGRDGSGGSQSSESSGDDSSKSKGCRSSGCHKHVEGCCGGEASDEESSEADKQGYSSTPSAIQDDIVSKVAEALSQRAAGIGAGELAREIERLVKRKPVINWRTLLRRYLTYAAGRVGKVQTYQRPPRNGSSGVIRPGRKWQGLRAVVIVDDSGSMSSELSWALSEVDAITREHFDVVYSRCDVEITYHKSVEELRRHLHCGGGTDILPAIEDAVSKYNPTVVIVLTDYCWASYADSWRGCPVVIVDPTGYGKHQKIPNGWHYVHANKEGAQ